MRETKVSGVKVVIGEVEQLEAAIRDVVLDAIRTKPDAALMFPTGSTPEGVYAAIISHYRQRESGAADPSWSEAKCFNMDEYWRMPPWDHQSYSWFMKSHLYDWVDVSFPNLYFPDAMAPTPEMACQAMEKQIAGAGGLDHCFLGIGVDGHIAFNEAGLPRGRTQVIDLAESTVEANKRFFASAAQVPTKALSAGIDTLIEARKISLLAKGEAKAKAIRAALCEPASVDCPASFLQEAPDRATFYLDPAAASLLPEG